MTNSKYSSSVPLLMMNVSSRKQHVFVRTINFLSTVFFNLAGISVRPWKSVLERSVSVILPLSISKLQWCAVSWCRMSWLKAYCKSIVVSYDLFCVAIELIFCEISCIRLSVCGIWCLFLWINLFKSCESSATITEPSVVFTLAEEKILSKYE